MSETRELAWYGADRQQGCVVVDAPGAQALIGFVRHAPRFPRHLAADVTNRFCSLLLVPLDGRPVGRSGRLLLAATAWCGNTGMQWDERRQAILEWGRGPVLIEPVVGTLELRDVPLRRARARALSPTGVPLGRTLPLEVAGDTLRIRLGEPPALLVLIEAPPDHEAAPSDR